MNQIRVPRILAAILFLAGVAVAPSWAQKSGSQQQPPSSGNAPGNAPTGPGQQNPGRSYPQMQTPLYVNGRVLMDTGQPVPEPVSVGITCGSRVLQVIRTDLKGYFQFVLGAGPQGNMTFNASDDTPMGADMGGGGMGFPGNSTGFGTMNGLIGCDLQISVDGYRPVNTPITNPPDLSSIDVGTFRLARIAGVQGSAISVTSLMVPNNARKEFEKGDKDARANKFPSATEHLEKAVAEYDKYAAAWTELGKVYYATHQPDKARAAYTKAIAADPQYLTPYLSLAGLQVQAKEYDGAIDTAGKALALNPGLAIAGYMQAVAYFESDRTDDAEKSALEAQKVAHQSIPQIHALLAEIFTEKGDSAAAAAQMRAYLKEAPKGSLAAGMKEKLSQLDAASGTTEDSKGSPHPEVAP